MKYDTVALYVCIADFCKIYKENIKHRLIGKTTKRKRAGKLDLCEQMFIVINYHLSHMRDFKNYYLYHVTYKHRNLFRDIPLYARFIQIMPDLFLPLSILMHCMEGKKDGIYYADSTKIALCNNARIRNNKTFDGLAKRGHTSVGWFYGFKLHMVINKGGEIVAVKMTKGNISDISVLEEITKGLRGNIYADKGYISKEVFASLYNRGLKLIVGIKKNMKNHLMDIYDKINLRKRYKIENAFCRLKYTMNIEHTRHRSPVNFCINILASLCAYMFSIHKNVKANLLNNAFSYP